MFKKPFSFKGRIRRLEYGLSFLILIAYAFTFSMVGEIALFENDDNSFFILIFIPAIWFYLAQCTKRCHDCNSSGWYQIIPFYRLIILFLEGNTGDNQYGQDPKGNQSTNALDVLDDDILLRHDN